MTLRGADGWYRLLNANLGVELVAALVTIARFHMANMTRDAEGRWKSVEPTLLHRNARLITATFRRKDGRTLPVRKATRAEPEQQKIFRALGTDPAPGGIRKMIV